VRRRLFDDAVLLLLPRFTGRRYRNAPSSPDRYPISRCCPACGSHEYAPWLNSITVAFAHDRRCTQCGTYYTPPPGKIWGSIFLLTGLLLCLFFFGYILHVLAAYMGLSADKSWHPNLTSLVCPLPFALFGLACVWHGSVAFGFYRHTRPGAGRRLKQSRRHPRSEPPESPPR
jgi:hypothetical protein